ncbi:MAG: TPM domain-containing protein [Bacteroidota bacterium]|nr:TPM domain-containing protein [Ferruginibacter sp.]
MGLFPFFKKPDYFSAEEKARVVEAIRIAEKETSGEIRIYVEGKNPFMDPMDRAREIFTHLKMQNTEHRNAVLLYIAMKDHELALYGDEGIFNKVGAEYWHREVKAMIGKFSKDSIVSGIELCISDIGQTLKETFPYEANTDKNELPDDIVFGH